MSEDMNTDHNNTSGDQLSPAPMTTSPSLTQSPQQRFRRDSLDRFGDDLCQHLLSYLTISQKLDLLFVSKQWKRSLIASQQSVTVSDAVSDHNHDLNGHHWMNTTNADMSVRLLERLRPLVKRFTDIRQLTFDDQKVVINGRILRAIATYCLNLRSLIVNNAVIHDMNAEDIQYFCQRLGPNINHLKIELRTAVNTSFQPLMFSLLDSTPNIRTIHLPMSFGSVDRLITIYSTLRLQSVCLNGLFATNEDFTQFVDVFGDRLKKIEFFFTSSATLSVDHCLQQLSRFNALEELSLHLNITLQPLRRLDQQFEELAKKCKQLTRFRLEVVTTQAFLDTLITNDWFSILGHFVSIKWLRFALIFDGKCEQKNYLNKYVGSVEALRHCSQLQRLYLVIKHINDQTFDEIGVHLPQLQSLRLVCSYCVITDLTFRSLSALPALRRFAILDGSSHEWRSIGDDAVCQLIDNNESVRSVEINCFSTIGCQSIEAFITRAETSPHRQLCFAFKDDFNIISDLFGPEFIPKNLELKRVVIPENSCLKTFLMRK